MSGCSNVESDVVDPTSNTADPTSSPSPDESSTSTSTLSDQPDAAEVDNSDGGDDPMLAFEVMATEFNRKGATSSDPTGGSVVVDQDDLAQRWSTVSDDPAPNVDGRLAVLVNAGPTYRNTEVTAVQLVDNTVVVGLLVHNVSECNGADVVASDVHLVAVTTDEHPDHVDVDVDVADGCGD